MNLGLKREVLPVEGGLPTPVISPPACSFDEIWKVAIEKGASKNAVASIDYGPDGYRFSIRDTSTQFRFGTDCRPR